MIAESSSSYLLSPPEPDRQLTATPRCRAENRLLARQDVANLVGEYHGGAVRRVDFPARTCERTVQAHGCRT